VGQFVNQAPKKEQQKALVGSVVKVLLGVVQPLQQKEGKAIPLLTVL
jgi:hypothetical protein